MKRLILCALLVAGACVPAFAQGGPTPARIRGTIVSATADSLTITTSAGTPATIALPPAVRITYFVMASLGKISAGSYIGVAAEPQPDGTLKALAVQIFLPTAKPNAGYGPWDLTPTSTMTNGTVDAIAATKVDKVDASALTVSYEGGTKSIVVTPKTAIVAIAPADVTALTPGAHVLVFASKAADGTLTARAIGVGKDGLIPPL